MGARGRAVLCPRALGRATLERQLLSRRVELPVVPAVERLAGLNAQEPELPYLALWSRLRRFVPAELTAAIEHGSLVRSTMMRATQHLVTVPDFRLIRPALAPLLRRVQRNAFGSRTVGADLEALVAEARALLDGRTLTRPELGRLLAATHPGSDPIALGWTVQYLEPVVHPAPSGTWGVRGATPFTLSDRTGVHREWTAAAPVRLLPAFDAALLAHADRTRVMSDHVRHQVCVGPAVAATVLIDGTVAATWTISCAGDTAVLTVRPFRSLAADRDAVEAEAATLLDALYPAFRPEVTVCVE